MEQQKSGKYDKEFRKIAIALFSLCILLLGLNIGAIQGLIMIAGSIYLASIGIDFIRRKK